MNIRLKIVWAWLVCGCSMVALAGKRIETHEVTLSDIRAYQAQLEVELATGRLKEVPARYKSVLASRSAELTELMSSPTAATRETELAVIGDRYFRFQNLAEQAALEVVTCRRNAHVGSRVGKQVCRSKAEERRQLQDNLDAYDAMSRLDDIPPLEGSDPANGFPD